MTHLATTVAPAFLAHATSTTSPSWPVATTDAVPPESQVSCEKRAAETGTHFDCSPSRAHPLPRMGEIDQIWKSHLPHALRSMLVAWITESVEFCSNAR